MSRRNTQKYAEMKILWQNKGFVKRGGGKFFLDVSPCLNATDYKEPSMIIEIEDDAETIQPNARWNVQND